MSDSKNVLPTTDERLDEHLHLAIIGLRQSFGHIEDAINLGRQTGQDELADDLGTLTADIAEVLSGTDKAKGLVEIREDIKAKIKKDSER